MSAPAALLGGTGTYVHWGFIQISAANLVVIGLMIAVFVVALVVPFPGSADDHSTRGHDGEDDGGQRS